jgi:outer membrane receptor for ferrienterochelin and colicins
MGSVRLTEVLSEQTGLVVVPQVNGQGNGIQVQGFNPDYTLILIDGEPLVGRYTGSLELNRISLGNIKQIEIVKGPSSSLYGSEALAGVINIITEQPQGVSGNFSTWYGSNNSLDLSGSVNLTNKKSGFYFFGNRYSTDGYDLSPENFGNTVSPFTNYTWNTKVSHKFSSATTLTISGRLFSEDQRFNFEVTSAGEQVRTLGNGTVRDWSVNPQVEHRFSDRLKAIIRLYATGYNTESSLNLESDNTPYYHDDFKQSFIRPEATIEYFLDERNIFTAGGGNIFEGVQTSRYGDSTARNQQTIYAFAQHEWTPINKLSVITGGRIDYNSVYGTQVSPKLSARYEFGKHVSLKGSFGMGFKAPDFRQLYFNFTNSAAGGYSVLGTEVAAARLAELDAEGQIDTYLYDPALLGDLKAERSVAINVGFDVKISQSLCAEVNVFHNDINNLIETQAVAITTSGQSIYSYRNLVRAYTQGVEYSMRYTITKNFGVSAGYQLLFAKDKDVVEAVKAGDVYWRDPNTLVTKRLNPNEYYGLYNRSRHTGNIKIFYNNEDKGIEANLRVIFRGKYGIGDIRGNIQGETIPSSDRNSNSILDVHDDFVQGYAVVNLSVAKTIKKMVRIQAGVDNLFDYTDPVVIPNLPGRLWYASIACSLSKNKSTNQ